jgi:hypothetical protein
MNRWIRDRRQRQERLRVRRGARVDHLMFYTPLMDGAVWGADLPKSPVMRNPQFSGAPEPIDVFMAPTRRWSDGTAASVM